MIILFRKSNSSHKSDPAFKQGIVYAPVNGKIAQTFKLKEKNQNVVKIIIHPWSETGIYLPVTSEVQDFLLTGQKPLFRYKKKKADEIYNGDLDKLSLTLRDINSNLIKLEFIRCILGALPKIIAVPGDRGKHQANIGHFPFGGTLLLYLPENYEIMVKEKDRIIAGETLLAGIRVSANK